MWPWSLENQANPAQVTADAQVSALHVPRMEVLSAVCGSGPRCSEGCGLTSGLCSAGAAPCSSLSAPSRAWQRFPACAISPSVAFKGTRSPGHHHAPARTIYFKCAEMRAFLMRAGIRSSLCRGLPNSSWGWFAQGEGTGQPSTPSSRC